jgi:hypothetical protein
MRTTTGTKYEPIEELPAGAMPVSVYAKIERVKNTSYVYVKYDRFKFGVNKKDGSIAYGEDPGYEIRDYTGIAFVIKTK